MSSQLKLSELKRRRLAAGVAQSSLAVPSSSVHATKMMTCETPAMECSPPETKTTPAVVINAPSQHKRNRDLLKAPSSAASAAIDNSAFVNANVAAAFDGQEDLSLGGMSSPQPRPFTAAKKVTPSPTIAAAPAIQQKRSDTPFLYTSKSNDDISMITHATPYSGTSQDLWKLHGFDPSETDSILKPLPEATVKSVHGVNVSVYTFVPQRSDVPDGFVKTMPATFAKDARQVFRTFDLHDNGLVDPVECVNHENCGLYASTSIAVPPTESKGPGMHPLTHCDGCAMDLDPNATWLKRPASCLCGAEKFDACKVCRSCRTKMPCKNCFATTGVHPQTRLCLESCHLELKRSYYVENRLDREELCVRCGINPLAGDRRGKGRTADQCSACRELCAHYTEHDGEKKWCTNKKMGTQGETLCLSHYREHKHEYNREYYSKRKANGGAPVLGNKAKFTEADVRDLVTAVDNAKKQPYNGKERVASWDEVTTQYNKGRPIEKQRKKRYLSDKYAAYKKSLPEK